MVSRSSPTVSIVHHSSAFPVLAKRSRVPMSCKTVHPPPCCGCSSRVAAAVSKASSQVDGNHEEELVKNTHPQGSNNAVVQGRYSSPYTVLKYVGTRCRNVEPCYLSGVGSDSTRWLEKYLPSSPNPNPNPDRLGNLSEFSRILGMKL